MPHPLSARDYRHTPPHPPSPRFWGGVLCFLSLAFRVGSCSNRNIPTLDWNNIWLIRQSDHFLITIFSPFFQAPQHTCIDGQSLRMFRLLPLQRQRQQDNKSRLEDPSGVIPSKHNTCFNSKVSAPRGREQMRFAETGALLTDFFF